MSDHLADAEVGNILRKREVKFIDFMLPKIPSQVETYHLTYMTCVWAMCILICGYLASEYTVVYGWGIIWSLIWRSITDKLDWAVGRARNAWLVKRGFYMDHIFDVILCMSLLVAAYMIAPIDTRVRFFVMWFSLLLLVFHIFIRLAATNTFRKSIWPIWATELQILLIVMILWVMYVPDIMFGVLPFLSIATVCGAVIVVYTSQRELWEMDMENRWDRGP